MYERFTDNARQCMLAANRVAQQLKQDHIGGLHIVIGVINSAPDACELLEKSATDINELRAAAVEIVMTTHSGGAKRSIEKAMDQARISNSKVIDVVHILLGTLMDPDESVVALFDQVGTNIDVVTKLLSDHLRSDGAA
jgi:ATP-dependent Clp protease ATP-binding subunit ClpA